MHHLPQGLVKQNGIDEPMPEDPSSQDKDDPNGKEEGTNGSEEEEDGNGRPPDTPREPRILPWTPKVRSDHSLPTFALF